MAYMEVAEQESKRQGWDNLAEMEYFSNIDKYENLSFVGQQSKQKSLVLNPESLGREIRPQKPNPKDKLYFAQTMMNQDGVRIYDLSDDDLACEEGASPALLGGFCVQSEMIENPDAGPSIILESEHPEKLAEDLQDEGLFDREVEDEDDLRHQGKRKRKDRLGVGNDSSDEMESFGYKRKQ